MAISPLFKVKDNAEGQLLSSIDAVTLSIPLQSGQGANFPQPVKSAATSAGTQTTLNLTGASGLSISVGDYIENVTDGSHAFIKVINTNDIETSPLRGGTDNTWESADVVGVNRFVVTLNSRDANGVITDYEQVLIENRSTDTLTVATGGRGYNGTTPDTWTASTDYVSLFVADPTIEGISDLLYRALANQLTDDGVTGMLNDTAFKAVNNAGSALVDLFKLTTGDVLEFQTLPRNPSSRIISNNRDLIDKEYYEGNFPAFSVDSESESSAANREIYENTDKEDITYHKDSAGLQRRLENKYTGTAGETINGTTTPQAVYIHTAGGSRTTDRYYLADADDTTNEAYDFAGFAINSTTAGNPILIQNGVVDGFSALSTGLYYYLSTTAGSITNTIPITSNAREVCVGRAISATEIDTNQRPAGMEFIDSVNASGVTSGSTITAPTEARFCVINVTTPNMGSNSEQGQIFLARRGLTNATFKGLGNVSTTATVTANWSGSTITLTSSANMAGTATGYFYR